MLECPIHGYTLFRCKRVCKKQDKKKSTFSNQYTEHCFKCISEGRIKKVVKAPRKRKQHIKLG